MKNLKNIHPRASGRKKKYRKEEERIQKLEESIETIGMWKDVSSLDFESNFGVAQISALYLDFGPFFFGPCYWSHDVLSLFACTVTYMCEKENICFFIYFVGSVTDFIFSVPVFFTPYYGYKWPIFVALYYHDSEVYGLKWSK